jgi:hypothetical protein
MISAPGWLNMSPNRIIAGLHVLATVGVVAVSYKLFFHDNRMVSAFYLILTGIFLELSFLVIRSIRYSGLLDRLDHATRSRDDA